MKRITFKVSDELHKELMQVINYEGKSIREFFNEEIIRFICNYIKNDFCEILAISKKEHINDKEKEKTISFEINKDVHKIFKAICTEKGVKVKHLVRGILIDSLGYEN